MPSKKSGIVILVNAGRTQAFADIIYDKIFEMWFNTDQNLQYQLEQISVPNLFKVENKHFAPGSDLYQLMGNGYKLSNKQKSALDKLIGWHQCQYGSIQLIKKGETYFLKGSIGVNISSATENGDIEDLIIGYDTPITIHSNSFSIYDKFDEFNYVFAKNETKE